MSHLLNATNGINYLIVRPKPAYGGSRSILLLQGRMFPVVLLTRVSFAYLLPAFPYLRYFDTRVIDKDHKTDVFSKTKTENQENVSILLMLGRKLSVCTVQCTIFDVSGPDEDEGEDRPGQGQSSRPVNKPLPHRCKGAPSSRWMPRTSVGANKGEPKWAHFFGPLVAEACK